MEKIYPDKDKDKELSDIKVSNSEQTEKVNIESENDLEQPNSELTTDSPQASKILNRFACVGDLENAYKSLRAEFTKKSQRLSELEQEVKERKTSACVAEILVDSLPPVVKNLASPEPCDIMQPHSRFALRTADKDLTSSEPCGIMQDYSRFALQTADQTQESDNSLKTLKGAASDEIIKNYLLSVAASKRQAPAVIANCAVDFAPMRQNIKKSMSDTTKEVENFFIRRKL